MTHVDHGLSPSTASIDVAVRQLDRDVVLVDTAGEIDLATHRQLETALSGALEPPAPGVLIADLSAVSFLDSAGVNALVNVQRRAETTGTELRIVSANRHVSRPLRITGMDRQLNLYGDRAAARE